MAPQPPGTVGVGGSRRQWGAKGRRRDGVGTAQPGASEDGHSPEPELPTGGKGSVPTACYTNTMPTTQANVDPEENRQLLSLTQSRWPQRGHRR